MLPLGLASPARTRWIAGATSALLALSAVSGPVARADDAPAPLAAWHAALAGATDEAADILLVGDSITEGYGAADRATWWAEQVRTELQQTWGGAGLGYQAAAPGLPKTFPAIWSVVGGDASVATGLGLRSRILAAPTARLEATVTADALRLVYTAGPDGGAMRIAIDGVVAGTVDTYAAATASRSWSSEALAHGTHTLSVQPVSTGQQPVHRVVVEGVLVMDGDAAQGVRVWPSGHSGYASAHFAGSTGWGSSVAQADPELVVIGLGTNDYTFGTTVAEFEANLSAMIAEVRARATGDVSIVLMPMWTGLGRDASRYREYVDAQTRLADELGLGLADLSRLDASVFTSDGVHPNAAGQRAIADTVLRVANPQHEPFTLRPSSPTGVVATAVDPTTASLSWTAPAGPVTDYWVVIHDRTTKTAEARKLTGSPAPITDLAPAHTYTFGLYANNEGGTGPGAASNTIALPGPARPAAPTGVVAAVGPDATTMALSWTAPPGPVTDYWVLIYDLTGKTAEARKLIGSPATITGLTPAHTYIFGLYANNEGGTSPGAASNTLVAAG